MSERYSRQQDIVPRERILDCKATVIGVGAIGRHVNVVFTCRGDQVGRNITMLDIVATASVSMTAQASLTGGLGANPDALGNCLQVNA